MRIAIDATYSVDPHPSGIAIYTRELLCGLAKRSSEDQLIACFRLKQWRQRRNVLANDIRLPDLRTRILQWPLPLGRMDLFHALNQRVDWRPARRVVSTFHDLFVMTADYSTPEFRTRFTKQAREAAAHSDLIIAVSRFTADQVHGLLGVEYPRIRVIPHGVHQPSSPPANAEQRDKEILFVGALQRRKNVTRLVQAFEQVNYLDWRLILAGAPNGFGAESTLEQIQKSPARDRIVITGYVSKERLRKLYARASIFAFPSLDEGFGIPILEAMANGLPVLTSNRSALIEIAGDAACTVDPLSVGEISESLKLLVEDRELRNRLAFLGRERAAQFSWEQTVRQTHNVYQEILN